VEMICSGRLLNRVGPIVQVGIACSKCQASGQKLASSRPESPDAIVRSRFMFTSDLC